MLKTDGKVLRIGGNPNNEKDWEVCTITDRHCQRHMHALPKSGLNIDIPEVEEETDAVSLDNYEKHSADKSAKEKIDGLLKSIDEGIKGVIDSGKIEQYLSHISKFHNYSFGNQMLIFIQKPEATSVAGYNKWEEMGRQVKKGEKGIDILAPVMIKKKKVDELTGEEKEDTVRIGFRGVKVFDISQTEPALYEFNSEAELAAFANEWEGKGYKVEKDDSKPFAARITGTPDSGAKLLEGEAPQPMKDFIHTQISSIGVDIQYGNVGGGANGASWKDPSTGKVRISVRDDVQPAQQIKTLTHELMHVRLGHLDRMDEYHTSGGGHRGEMEVAVEALSFMVGKHFGLDTGDYSHGYMAGWAKNNPDRVREVLEKDVVPFFKEFMKELPDLGAILPMGTSAAKRRAAKASRPTTKKKSWGKK
jgi:antirestriction protein ArdC